MIATNGRYYKFNDEDKDDESGSSLNVSTVVNHRGEPVEPYRDFD